MRLAAKLSLLLACSTALPLVLVIVLVLPGNTRALRSQLAQLYAQDARSLALESQQGVMEDLEALSLAARTLRLADLPDESREQALVLLYKDTRRADVIGLFDEKGQPVVPAVRFEALQGQAAKEHEAVGELGLVAYSHHVPLDAALETGLAIGPVYALPDNEGAIIPRVVLAAKVPEKKWVLAMELSLRPVVKLVREYKAGESGAAILVDSRNRVIAGPDPVAMRDRADLSGHPLIAGDTRSDIIGAVEAAPVLGWKVVVQQSSQEGLGTIRRLALQATLYVALAVLVALLGGVFLVRRVTEPVRSLQQASHDVRKGKLSTRIEVRGKDELAELAASFNEMVAGLEEREDLRLLVSLSSTIDLQQMLHRLLDSLAKAQRYDRAAVLIQQNGAYGVAVSRGYLEDSEPALLIPRPGGEGTTDRATRLRGPVRSPKGDLLALPIVSREDAVAGLVCLESKAGFTDEQAQAIYSWLQPAAIAFDNARLFEEVKRLATVDGLTGISNRRHFLALGTRIFETARRYGQPLAAMMIDVDFFKRVNDRFGHAQGDLVLRAIAERCVSSLRSADMIGRYGGEEFAVLLPMTQAGPALTALAERIRRTVAGDPIQTASGPIAVTVSIGIASLDPAVASLEALLDRADSNLYHAKEEGRNRVFVA